MATEDRTTRPAAKKQATKKQATKKQSTAKKAPAKKSTANKSTANNSTGQQRPARTAMEIADGAARQLGDLTGRQSEGVTGLERTEDGWKVSVDVLELRRVPDTTDVLASYEVEVDTAGDLTGYRRVHRYVRGSTDQEQ